MEVSGGGVCTKEATDAQLQSASSKALEVMPELEAASISQMPSPAAEDQAEEPRSTFLSKLVTKSVPCGQVVVATVHAFNVSTWEAEVPKDNIVF